MWSESFPLEGMFPDGTKLVTMHDPIRPGKKWKPTDAVTPGGLFVNDGEVEINAVRSTVTMKAVV